MLDKFIGITQGSVGVLEGPADTVGFISEKIASCRVSVFECEGGTLLLHDTGQIQFDALCTFIAQYGAVNALRYAIGLNTAEDHHNKRLGRIAEKLNFRMTLASPIRINQPSFAVAYTNKLGLVPAEPRYFSVLRDPNESVREAVNVLNDWFIPAKSQTAPLDIQYQQGAFTPPPAPQLTLLEMLNDLRNDDTHGLLGASALGHYGPKAGLQLPAEFLAFLAEHRLVTACYDNLPVALRDKGKAYREVMAKFVQLPIFG